MSETTYSITDLTPTLIKRLFEPERRVFNRSFDLPSRLIEEFITYNGKDKFILASEGSETLSFLRILIRPLQRFQQVLGRMVLE